MLANRRAAWIVALAAAAVLCVSSLALGQERTSSSDRSVSNSAGESGSEVTYDGKHLTVLARNATARELLETIHAKTGVALDGLQWLSPERLSTQYPAAAPRAVIIRLLVDAGCSFVLLGTPGNPDMVRRIVILPKDSAPSQEAPQPVAEQAPEPDSDGAGGNDSGTAGVPQPPSGVDPPASTGSAAAPAGDRSQQPQTDKPRKVTICGIEYDPWQVSSIRIPQHCGAGYTPQPSVPPGAGK